MESDNSTQITDFVLSTFSDLYNYQTALFAVFLFILVITLTGNLVIIVLTCWDPQLQSPMYFLLGNLSFVDICLSLVTVPQMLKNFLLELKSRVILFESCMAQIYFFLTFANVEDFLLAVMAYDRYIAICDPLHYVGIHIILAILKIHSAEGRSKVFSTCSSHLAVVIFYFGTIMFTYFRPSSSYSLTKDRVASVMYTVLAPMLNPFIYSLRNKDVKQALQRLMAKINSV